METPYDNEAKQTFRPPPVTGFMVTDAEGRSFWWASGVKYEEAERARAPDADAWNRMTSSAVTKYALEVDSVRHALRVGQISPVAPSGYQITGHPCPVGAAVVMDDDGRRSPYVVVVSAEDVIVIFPRV